MQIADLVEEEISKIAEISGGTEIDGYLIIHLSQCIMTLITTFESGPRLKKIIKSVLQILEKSK